MPSSVRDGVRPSAASMRAYSSAVRLCCFSSSAEMLAGEGTAGSVLVVMAINILSHDQRRLSVASTPPFPGAGKRRMEVKNGQEKQKGAISLERAPPAIRIFEDLDRLTRSQLLYPGFPGGSSSARVSLTLPS